MQWAEGPHSEDISTSNAGRLTGCYSTSPGNRRNLTTTSICACMTRSLPGPGAGFLFHIY